MPSLPSISSHFQMLLPAYPRSTLPSGLSQWLSMRYSKAGVLVSFNEMLPVCCMRSSSYAPYRRPALRRAFTTIEPSFADLLMLKPSLSGIFPSFFSVTSPPFQKAVSSFTAVLPVADLSLVSTFAVLVSCCMRSHRSDPSSAFAAIKSKNAATEAIILFCFMVLFICFLVVVLLVSCSVFFLRRLFHVPVFLRIFGRRHAEMLFEDS